MATQKNSTFEIRYKKLVVETLLTILRWQYYPHAAHVDQDSPAQMDYLASSLNDMKHELEMEHIRLLSQS